MSYFLYKVIVDGTMFPINGVVPQQNKPSASANTYPWRTQFTGGGGVVYKQNVTKASVWGSLLAWLRGTPVPPQQKSNSSSGIWLPLLLGLGAVAAIALRPQKMLRTFRTESSTIPASAADHTKSSTIPASAADRIKSSTVSASAADRITSKTPKSVNTAVQETISTEAQEAVNDFIEKSDKDRRNSIVELSKKNIYAEDILKAAANDPEPLIRREALNKVERLSNQADRDKMLEERYNYILRNKDKYNTQATRDSVIQDHLGVIQNIYLHSSRKYRDSVYKAGIQHTDSSVRLYVVKYSVSIWPERENLLVEALKDPAIAADAIDQLVLLPSIPVGYRRCGYIIKALETSDNDTCLDILESLEDLGYLSDAHVDSILKKASQHRDAAIRTKAEFMTKEKAEQKAQYEKFFQNRQYSEQEPFKEDSHPVFKGIEDNTEIAAKLKLLKNNYKKLSLQCHPDRLNSKGISDQEAINKAGDQFQELAKRYFAREKYYKDKLEKEEAERVSGT